MRNFEPEIEVELSDLTQFNLTQFKWPTESKVVYRIPEELKNVLIARYGSSEVIRACKDAYIWLVASPSRLKTPRGMGKFISGWLSRNIQMPRPVYANTVNVQQQGGLLSAARNTITSW